MMLSGPVGLSGDDGIEADGLRVGLEFEAARPFAAFFERAIRIRKRSAMD